MHSSGYVRVHYSGGVKKLKQRVVMSDHLGRELYRHETVHHKDGNRLNNDLGNLELWSKMQPAGQRVADKMAWVVEMALAYPDFLRTAGYELKPVHGATDEPPSSAELRGALSAQCDR